MTILTPAQVQEIEGWWSVCPEVGHSDDCWMEHKECALARLIASHRAVVEELERQKAEVLIARNLADMATSLADTHQAEATRLREFLERTQWRRSSVGEWSYCDWCGAQEDDGHKPGCSIAMALSGPAATLAPDPHEAERR